MSEHEPPPASADAAAAPHDTPAGAQHEAPAVPAAAAAAEPAAPSVAAAEAAHATPPPAATPATLPTESAPHHPAASSVEEMAPSTVPALPAQLDGADDADAKAAPPLVTPTTARVAVAVKDEADDMDDDGTAAASSYGTRSRNRAGPRPNYADETDDAFEAGLIMDEGAAAAAAAASTAAAAPAVSKQSSAEAPSRAARLEQPPQSMPTAAGATASPSAAQAAGNAPADPPRQKRKYVWKNGSRPNRNAEASTSEAPAKRRKTEDAPATVASTAPVKASAKTIVRDSSVFSFEKTGAMLQDGKLIADDGTEFCVDDNVYLVCEPPSEPYYLARIMEFRKDDMNDANAPITHMLVNWWFRPKDIGRFSIDARQLFASMQSDESPLMSLRGKLVVKHRNQISDFDEFRRQRDSFWFMQLYDRYIQRVYDMVPAEAVFNVPPNVKKAIDERWKFLVVEPVRAKELTSAVKLCKRCNGYSAPNDSVDCGVCKNTYHMDCVRPPLLKKPSRGFAWSCGPCSRAREKKLEARHNTTLSDGEDEDAHEEEDDAANADSSAASVVDTAMFDVDESTEVNKANMWPWRYLGIHCSVEDILQHDDRAVYPRASTRLGLRHQAAVGAWPGRPIELVKPPEARKRHYKTTAKKESKLFNLKAWKEAKMAKEAAASSAAEAEKSGRPKWIQDEPVGYVARGEDYDNGDPRCTAERLFVAPATDAKPSFAAANVKTNSHERICDDYMAQLKGIARQRGFTRHVFPLARSDGSKPEPQIVLPTNYIDKALQALCKHNFNLSAALAEMHNVRSPRDFKDPVLSQDDLRKFEDGVAKYGSELRLVRKHVSKTRSHGEIVRFYYNWKKTERGQVIWGRHDARKGSRRKTEASWTEIADDEDDSAFDNGKAVARKRKFVCKFCSTTTSRRWRRAPVAPGAVALVDPKGSAKDKANQQVVALCQRCAIPWRRYGIRWEDPEEYAKSVNATSGRALKRINDELMLRELVLANEEARVPTTGIVASAAALVGITVTVTSEAASGKKKQEVVVESKKKAAPAPPPRPPTPPIVPGEPKMRAFPCAVCAGGEDVEPLIACAVCRLTVHRRCFAVPEHVKDFKWTCDTCVNDKTAAVSFNYNCVLCTVHDRQQVMVEAPKSNSRKKTDRDRERERQEKVLADKMAADYKRDQLAKGRPLWPREAVKPTASNNWVHVTCAVWTPEVRFADARKLEGAEGIGSLASIPARLDAVCKLCKTQDGACVGCNVDKCAATFHVGCAREAGYRLGFDIRPVKSTQKSNTTTIALGNENGLMSAVVYCPDHDPAATPILHSPVELHAESGRTALQAFVESYKQADKTLTGTARKANMLSQSAKTAAVATSRDVKKAVPVWTAPAPADDVPILDRIYLPEAHEDKRNVCLSCGNDTSFRWWLAEFRAIYQAESEGRPIRRSDGIPDEVQCHRCHVLETKGIIPTPPPSDGDEDVPPPPKDFFELASRAAAGKAANGAWDGLAAQQDYDLRLGKLRITIVAPNGDRLAFHGQELRVFDPPLHIWNHVVGTLVDKLRYDVGRQVVISQMGQAIRSGEDLLAVVSHMMRDGVYLVTWRIVDGGPGHGSAGPDRLQHAGSPPPPPVMPPRLSPSPITFGPLQGQGTAPAPPQAHRDGPGPGPGPGSARSPIHMHASQARHLSPLLPGPPPPHHGPPQGMSPPPGMMHAPPPPGPPQGPPQGLMHHGPPGPPPPHMYGPPSSLHHRGPPPGPPMHHPSYGPTGPASHSSGHSPVSMPRDSMGATLPPLLGERDGLARGYEHAPPRMLQGHPGHASHYAHSHPHPGQPGAMSPPLVNGHLPSPRDRYSAPPPHGQHGQHHHPHGQHPQHQHPQHQYPHPHHQPHQGPHPHSQPLPAQPPLPPHLQPRHDGAASTSASLRNLMH